MNGVFDNVHLFSQFWKGVLKAKDSLHVSTELVCGDGELSPF